MGIRQRLARLEKAMSPRHHERCPRCPRMAVVHYRQDSLEGEPVLQEGEQLPGPCTYCGRPTEVLAVIEDAYYFQRQDPAPR